MDDLIIKKKLLKEVVDPVFVKPLDSNLKCVECKNLLQRPKQTPCGHRLCQDCLGTLTQRSSNAIPRCPIDNNELVLNEIFNDKCCERDILALQCFCLNSKKGCEWQGDLSSYYKEHVKKCEYTTVTCPNEGCSATMEKRFLQDHVTNDCDYRLHTCENCSELVAQADIEKHHSQCAGANVQCSMGCGASLYRKDMTRHVTAECPKASVICPLQQQGCDFIGTREDLEKHNFDCKEKHIQIMAENQSKSTENTKKIEEKVQNLESEKELLDRQIQDSKQVLASTKQDFQTLQSKIRILEKHMGQLKNSIAQVQEMQEKVQDQTGSETALQSQVEEIVTLVRSQEKRINDLMVQEQFGVGPRSFSGHSSSSDRRLAKNEHLCATNEVSIAEHDLRIQMLEATSYDGSYIWKIDEWARRIHEAQIGKTTSLYSPPFYVGRFGYKVCGRLYPCGDGIGKGTHLSMFFVVMKGEYDALLPWPFRQKVTFKLIDPNRLNDITDSFRPDPNSSSFQRPKSSMNVASGTPKFVSHRTLDSYVVENTLYIKISVEKTGLVDL